MCNLTEDLNFHKAKSKLRYPELDFKKSQLCRKMRGKPGGTTSIVREIKRKQKEMTVAAMYGVNDIYMTICQSDFTGYNTTTK